MKRDEIFACWAPAEARWSPWVKPVLFAHLPAEVDEPAPACPFEVPPSWLLPPPAHLASYRAPASPASDIAIIVDLPGARAVEVGLGLAAAGFAPVPLYNAIPGPAGTETVTAGKRAPPNALLDLAPIQAALVSGARLLEAQPLPLSAPPAFLLDAGRRAGRGGPDIGRFDNRWLVFRTDFPSGDALRAAGIARVLVLQERPRAPASDLAPALRAFRDAGLELWVKDTSRGDPPARGELPRAAWISRIWSEHVAPLALRRQPGGAFGATVPRPSSS